MLSVKNRLLNIQCVSQLTIEDEQFFRVAFPRDAVRYSRSWLYTLRASHFPGGELGLKYTTEQFVAVIGYRNKYIYVTPVFDATAGVKLQELCDAIIEATGQRVILKKFSSDIAQVTTSAAKRLPLEDDHAPEVILQMQRLFVSADGLINPAATRVIRKVRTFEERSKDFVVVEDIKTVPLEKIEHFLATHKEKYENYVPMVRYLAAQSSNIYSYRIAIFLYNDEIRGLYITEKLSLTELGFYCGVTTKDEPGLTEWMDIYFFRKMFKEGVQTVYLGGSERDGIAQFINKLLPYRPSYSVQALLYRSAKPLDMGVVIRQARESDFTALADVYRNTYNAMDTLGECWTKETAHKFISHFYRRQADLFFVAEYEGAVIGAIVAGVQPWWDGNHLVEGELFIDAKYEKLGVGRKLLKQLLLQASKTYKAVAWDTIMPDIKAHPLGSYKEMGFSEVPHWKALSGDTHTLLARLGA